MPASSRIQIRTNSDTNSVMTFHLPPRAAVALTPGKSPYLAAALATGRGSASSESTPGDEMGCAWRSLQKLAPGLKSRGLKGTFS